MKEQQFENVLNPDELNVFQSSSQKVLSTKATILVVITIFLLGVCNVYLTNSGTHEGITHLDGAIASQSEITRARFTTILFSIPLLGFLLGTLVSFIPYKKKTYSEKYVAFSLFTLLSLQTMLFISGFVDYMWK